MPKVSIIIPIYNVEKYIERCARSLFEQTEEDLEFIFVNDVTPDNSIQILNGVIKDYPSRKNQIKILENEKNLGIAETRFKGIMEASGEYIIHCDSDDWVDINMYRMLYEKAKAEDLDLVWCDLYRTDGATDYYISQKTSSDKLNLQKWLLSGKIMGSLCNHLVKRNIMLKNELIYPKNNMIEDLVLVIQLTFYAESIGYLAKSLYYYRHNPYSITNDASMRSKILSQALDYYINECLLFDFIAKKGLSRILKKEIALHKVSSKNFYLSLINKTSDCHLWIDRYPELNVKIFFMKDVGIRTKLTALLIILRLYPLLRRFFTSNKESLNL